MFEAPSYINFRDILMTSFQWPNLQKAITRKNKNKTFFNFHQVHLPIIFYQLTKFEATCCNSFWDILTTSFQCQNLPRVITRKNFFFYFHQVIYSLSSISWPSLKLLAVIVFEIFWLQVFNAKNLQRKMAIKTFFKIFTRLSTHYPLLPVKVLSS